MKRLVVVCAMLVVIAASVGFIVGRLSMSGVIASNSSSSCTLGITGTTATITFTASDASSLCQNFMSSGIPSPGFYNYQGTSPIEGQQFCSGNYGDGQYIVRDVTAFSNAAPMLCYRLR